MAGPTTGTALVPDAELARMRDQIAGMEGHIRALEDTLKIIVSTFENRESVSISPHHCMEQMAQFARTELARVQATR